MYWIRSEVITVQTREKPQGGGAFFRFLNEVSSKKSPTSNFYYFFTGNSNENHKILKEWGFFFRFSNEASTKKSPIPLVLFASFHCTMVY